MKDSIKRLIKYTLLLQAVLLAALSALPVAAQEYPRPARPIHNGVDAVEVKISASDNQTLSVSYSFPAPHLWITEGEEKVNYLQFAIPGMEQAYGELGKPAVPFYTRLLALPQGAEVAVTEFEVETGDTLNQRLYPVQASPVDVPAQQADEEKPPVEDYQDPPFTINDDFYNGDHRYPETPVLVEVLGEMGNLRLARVSVATAQYSTAKESLTFFKAVRFTLSFSKGEEHFLTERDLIDFNRPDDGVVGLLLNGATIFNYTGKLELSQFICLGYEYLIITDPLFRPAADTLAAAKNSTGISTRVVETGTGAGKAGATPTAIKSYIADQYDECVIQLKYVLLLGDAEHIAPWYNRTYGSSPFSIDTPGADLEYALLNGNDLLPDIALGRIPVDTLAQANTMVTKIIRYEQTPPTQANFYEDFTLAGYFQCCRPRVFEWVINLLNPLQLVDGVTSRSFIETAELAFNELSGEGYNVRRIYTTSNAYHNNNSPAWLWNYYNPNSRDTTPRFYYNEAPLPAALAPGNFAWNGDGLDVVDAINDGSFLILHRDHGYKFGWGDPDFNQGQHWRLNNGDLTPVIYSINCASGLFDNETRDPANDSYDYDTQVSQTYWAEDLLRRSGGAVAIIGDTRNSPTWANSALARGLIDATWPGTVPEGGNTRTRRMGKILNYGKLYLLGQVGVAQTAGSVSNNNAEGDVLMFHLLGDPTMKLWRQNPNTNTPPRSYTFRGGAGGSWLLNYNGDGATVTALQGNNTLARGTVTAGSATLSFLAERAPATPVQFSLSAPDAPTFLLPLTQTSVVVTKAGGELTGADKRLKIAIPPDALGEESELVLTEMAAPAVDLPKNHTALASFLLEVSGVKAALAEPVKPLTLELCVAAEDQKKLKAAFLAHFLESEGRWAPIDAKLDEGRGCFTAEIDRFSEFALLRDESLSFGDDEETNIYLPFVAR
jgi:hypothetical protein